MSDQDRYELALRRIAGRHGCENFTTGLGSCLRPMSGRSINARYGADAACDHCIAADALWPWLREEMSQ